MESNSKPPNAPGPKKRPPLRASNLSGLKYFAQLSELKGLQTLNLGVTKITNAGLTHLMRLTKLKKLELWGTKITSGGVMGLRLALPFMKIVDPDD